MKVSFYGACREVTGSNFLVEADNCRILLDCGFFQGGKFAEERNFAPFQFDPASIDYVVVGHAHLDHTGRLPKLVKEGFGGKIFSTPPTRELTKLVLEDAHKLMEESCRDNHPLLYSRKDIETCLDLFETIPYNKQQELASRVRLTLKNAGHILGSAISILEAENQKLVYTSDLGNRPSLLLDEPELVDGADYVICESTYGDRIHEDVKIRREKLANVISGTIAQNGVLLIPSFAVERTQELLHDIEHFCSVENCERPTFFLDSPLAAKVTSVFKKYPEYLSSSIQVEHESADIFGLKRLKITKSARESEKIFFEPNPKIIIAGSGMMNGGRILSHLAKYISDPKNTLLIVGYQTQGAFGRRLIDKEKVVKIFGRNYQVKCKVLAIGSYSAHADSLQLVSWLTQISNLRKVFLVHGETDQELGLAKAVKKEVLCEVAIPQQGESYILE